MNTSVSIVLFPVATRKGIFKNLNLKL